MSIVVHVVYPSVKPMRTLDLNDIGNIFYSQSELVAKYQMSEHGVDEFSVWVVTFVCQSDDYYQSHGAPVHIEFWDVGDGLRPVRLRVVHKQLCLWGNILVKILLKTVA